MLSFLLTQTASAQKEVFLQESSNLIIQERILRKFKCCNFRFVVHLGFDVTIQNLLVNN